LFEKELDKEKGRLDYEGVADKRSRKELEKQQISPKITS